MIRIAVAGVVNVRMAMNVTCFPVPYVSSQRQPNGLSVRLSGTGWTAATTLRALGANVRFATYVGSDPLGSLAAQGLQERGWYGTETRPCAQQPRALVLYDRAGRRSNTSDLRSTPNLRYPAEVFDQLLGAGRFDQVMLSNIGFTRSLIPVAVRHGLPIATDVHRISGLEDRHNEPWLRAAQLVACSHECLPCSPEDWVIALWRRFGTRTVLVGCGASGAVVGSRDSGQVWHIEAAVPRPVRYSSGAGDTLLASYVYFHNRLGDPIEAARYAVLAAGWKVGGQPDEEFALTDRQLCDVGAARGLPAVSRLR